MIKQAINITETQGDETMSNLQKDAAYYEKAVKKFRRYFKEIQK